MRIVHLITLGLLAAAGGCSQPESAGMSGNRSSAGNSAKTSETGGPSGVEGMRQLAKCASTFEAVGNLWEAIASQSSGAEKEEAETTALRRRASSGNAGIKARAMAKELNRPADEVDRIRDERKAELKQEEERQDFGDFAVWLGREADRCTAFDPSIR